MTTIDRQTMEQDLGEHLAAREGAGLLPRSEQALLKSYVVEAHEATSVEDAVAELERAAGGDGFDLQSTQDPTLHLLIAPVDEASGEAAGFWVDSANPRFWLLHAKTKATVTRQALRRLTARNPHLDAAWLPREQLRRMQHSFSPIGFKLGFDERPFYKGRDVAELKEPTHKLRMEHAGVGAEGVYRLLEQDDRTRRAMAIAEVAFWERTESGTQDMRLTREGRLQSTGQSLDSHLGAAHRLLTSYERFVRELEASFALRLSATSSGDVVLEGRPLAVSARKPESFEFRQLVDRLVAGVEPFRLLGSVEWRDDDLAWVEAVDLHTGSPVRMDLTPDWLRMYLSGGVCGNTLARFVTNLQRSYDADLRALDVPGQELLLLDPAG